MKNVSESNKLALRMLIGMIAGIVIGLGFMALREALGSDSSIWTTINNLLFQDITAKGGHVPAALYAQLDKIEANLG